MQQSVYFTAQEILCGLANYEEHEVQDLTGEEAERLAYQILKADPALAEAKVTHRPAACRRGSFIHNHRERKSASGLVMGGHRAR